MKSLDNLQFYNNIGKRAQNILHVKLILISIRLLLKLTGVTVEIEKGFVKGRRK